MARFLLTFGLAALLAVAAGQANTGAKADDKKPAGQAGEKGTPTKATAESKGFQALSAAGTLARLGRESKSPLLLLAAARVVGTTQFQKFDLAEAKQESKGAEFDVLEYTGGLIKEARDLAPGDAAVEAMAKKVEDEIKSFKRGAQGGPKVWNGYLQKGFNTTDTYYCTFVGGQPAFVEVKNFSNRGDIDLYVYNANTGALIARDVRTDDDASVAFNPGGNTRVRIVIKAYAGNAPMQYSVRTN